MTLPTDYQDAEAPTGALDELPATGPRGLNTITATINEHSTELGRASQFSTEVGNTLDTQFDVVHNLGNVNVAVTLRAIGSGELVRAKALVLDANTIRLVFADPPGNSEFMVTVQGGSMSVDVSNVSSIDISDSTAIGRTILTAPDQAAVQAAVGYAAPTVASTDITDSTATGRAVLTAASAAAGRTAIGAGTSNLALGTTGTTAAAGNDSRLSNTRTPTDGSVSYAKLDAGVKASVDKADSAVQNAGGGSGLWIGSTLPGSGQTGVLYVVTP